MKKLMIAVCAVVFAVAAQAATVSWATGTLYAPGADGTGYAAEYGMIDPGTAGVLATLTIGTGSRRVKRVSRTTVRWSSPTVTLH